MKRFSALKTSLVLLLVAGLVGVYWQIRNVDPEGACKGLGNFSMCLDAWIEYDGLSIFRKLPTDQEMIDNFHNYRGDFDDALDKVFSNGFSSSLHPANPSWRDPSGVKDAFRWSLWPPKVYTSLHFDEPWSNREWSWQFPVASTKYIAGAKKYWPWVNRLKGYVYFPLPAPQIVQGRLIGPVYRRVGPEHIEQQLSWRVLDQLDENWPTDWQHDECLLRRIEPQWFLFLCKDHIGG